MSDRPPKFGDVYEWLSSNGVMRWMVIANEVDHLYSAALVMDNGSAPRELDVGTIGIGLQESRFHPRATQTRISDDD